MIGESYPRPPDSPTSLDSPTLQFSKSPAAFVLAAILAALLLLAAGLRPDAFFVGDPGVKLIVARNAALRPARPLEIPLPAIGTDRTPHVDPFFSVHGDHAHAVTSEFFPLVSAPLLAAFGTRGLYVWPALGFLVALAGCAWLARTLDPRRSAALQAVVAALGTPLIFYGLEFWEHAPAVAAGAAGAALLLDGTDRRAGSASQTLAREFGAGVLFGVATLLRPEAAWFALAVVVASRALPRTVSMRAAAAAALGAVLTLAPLAVYSLAHLGSVVPAHLSANAASASGGWLPARLDIASAWLLPSWWTSSGPVRPSSLWNAAPAAFLCAVSLVQAPRYNGRTFLWLLAALDVAAILLSAPNDGGGQWGPRYLLFACVPLSILAADLVQSLLAVARGQPEGVTAVSRSRRRVAVAALVLFVVACVWVQRAGYRQLRGTKNTYGRIVDFVAEETAPGYQVVTDIWWLDQLAAAGLDGRVVFFAGDSATGTAIVRRLGEQHVQSVTVVRSREVSPTVETWTDGTCYAEDGRAELDVRSLVAIRLRYRC